MNIKIADLMANHVVTTLPHKTMGHVKDIMNKNNISAVPVVNSDNEPIGIITTSDFQKKVKDSSPVKTHLSGDLFQVPAYNDVSVAAKVMLKNKIHHVLVTHEGKLVGILSSFDLIKLIDEKRFTMKNPPS